MTNGSVAIIDDDQMVRTATASLLSSVGISTQTFDSARQYLQSDRATVGCVVTDIQMRDMSGMDLVRTLREARDAVPVILITAYATPLVLAQAKAPGILGLLEKPLDGDRLIALVVQALQPGTPEHA